MLLKAFSHITQHINRCILSITANWRILKVDGYPNYIVILKLKNKNINGKNYLIFVNVFRKTFY